MEDVDKQENKFNESSMRKSGDTSLCSRFHHFPHLPCSGITGRVQLEGGALFFNPCPILALK